MDNTPDTVHGEVAAAATSADPPAVRWPDPSPLADWWIEVMRHHPTEAARPPSPAPARNRRAR